MLIVAKVVRDDYFVLDTDDDEIDVVSSSELLDILFLYKSITIYGATKDSLYTKLILRFAGKDYDGLFLSSPRTYDKSMVQVIDLADVDENYFDILVSIVKERNPDRNVDVDTALPVGYKVEETGKHDIKVRSLKNGQLYSCNFYTCLYIYMILRESIEGITEVTVDYLKYGDDTIYYGVDYLQKLRADTDKTVSIKVKDYIENTRRLTWGSIDSHLQGSDFLEVTDCRFPVFNIKNQIVRVNELLAKSRFRMLHERVVDFDKGTLLFSDGSSLNTIVDIASYWKVLRFESAKIADGVERYFDSYKSKEVTLRGESQLSNYLGMSRCIPVDCMEKVHEYKILDIPDSLVCTYRTSFGLIMVTHSSVCDFGQAFDILLLSRVPAEGFCWFDPFDSYLTTGDSKMLQESMHLNRGLLDEVRNSSIDSGLSYFSDYIIPLGLNYVESEQYHIDINVFCLISDGEIYNMVSVPLLFLGCRLKEFDDCFELRCMLHTIYLDKSVVYNLCGDFSENNFLMCYNKLTKVRSQRIFDYLYKKSKSILLDGVKNL